MIAYSVIYHCLAKNVLNWQLNWQYRISYELILIEGKATYLYTLPIKMLERYGYEFATVLLNNTY